MANVLPEPEEIAALAPRPGSALWRYAGDARLIAAGAYAILLQVAHPTVGAGVSQHSEFRADPWGRLLRTLDYSYVMVYGGPEAAAEMGRRLREMHKRIKGELPDGKPYHALEPEAFAWVHATLADSIVRSSDLLARPLGDEVEQFYAEWRSYGRLIGLREGDLPGDWGEFREYFDEMVERRLERTAAVDEVLESLVAPIRPEVPYLPEAVWRVARVPAAWQVDLVTGGLLPEALRDRFGITWTRWKQLQLNAFAGGSRALTPLLPGRIRNIGPPYLRWRREAIARGDAMAGTRTPAAA
jgi:uncharacterized protein (DUF2236 family)